MLSNLIKCGAIGVIDSGIGGLNILNALLKNFNNYNYLYYGDNKNAPYGNKLHRELKRLVSFGIGELVENNAKIIVVACNTLSTAVAEYVKAISPVPVVFTLPINNYDKEKYKAPCLISTPVTANSDFVKKNFCDFTVVPLPFLAGEIERYVLTPKKISVDKDLNAIPENTDYLFLGCTHYIYIKKVIERLTGIKVNDNRQNVLRSVANYLPSINVREVKGKPTVYFLGNSADYNFTVFHNCFVAHNHRKVTFIPKIL